MPNLSRHRDPEAQQETWLIHNGDVRVGVIAERVGNPDSTPGWEWALPLAVIRANARTKRRRASAKPGR